MIVDENDPKQVECMRRCAGIAVEVAAWLAPEIKWLRPGAHLRPSVTLRPLGDTVIIEIIVEKADWTKTDRIL